MEVKKKLLQNVIVLGDSKVGKTSLITQFVENRFQHQYATTVSADFQTREIAIGDRIVIMHIWDTPGQEYFQPIQVLHFRIADCCVLVFDVTSLRSFKSLNKWWKDYVRHVPQSDRSNCPIIVIGNKIDLENRVISRRRVQKWCKIQNNIKYFETSAKETINVEEAFKTLTKFALAQEPKIERHYDALLENFESNNDRINKTKSFISNNNFCTCQ